jgi:hypothetical protein
MVGRRSAGGGDRRPRPAPRHGAACAMPGVRAVPREGGPVTEGSRFDQLARGGHQCLAPHPAQSHGGGVLAALGLARTGGGVGADDTCKPAAPKPQSTCTKDAQCCAGLVCQGGNCRPGCRVNGTFYASGTANPANPCQSRQPSVSTTRFTNKPNGTTCDDGNACTQTDTCQAGVCVGSNDVVCTASDQCHVVGTCDPTTGVCSNAVAPDSTPATMAKCARATKPARLAPAMVCPSRAARSAARTWSAMGPVTASD